jgi:hypothetical protein
MGKHQFYLVGLITRMSQVSAPNGVSSLTPVLKAPESVLFSLDFLQKSKIRPAQGGVLAAGDGGWSTYARGLLIVSF